MAFNRINDFQHGDLSRGLRQTIPPANTFSRLDDARLLKLGEDLGNK